MNTEDLQGRKDFLIQPIQIINGYENMNLILTCDINERQKNTHTNKSRTN